jgi:hypothetical protein
MTTLRTEPFSSEPEIAPFFADVVAQAAEEVLIVVAFAASPEDARHDLLTDEHIRPFDTGTYRVTSAGRTQWQGRSLMGALTAQVSEDYRRPVRIWRTTDDGVRRLVLVDNYVRSPR